MDWNEIVLEVFKTLFVLFTGFLIGIRAGIEKGKYLGFDECYRRFGLDKFQPKHLKTYKAEYLDE